MDNTTRLSSATVLGDRVGSRVSAGGARRTEEREHFVALFHESFESLHRYLNRLSGDTDLASDLAQEAFVRLYKRRTLPDDPKAWLFTVATNLFRNAMTKQSNRARLLTYRRGLRVHSDPTPSPEATAEGTLTRRSVRSALNELGEREQSLLLLAAEGHSYREMAKILELREASVGTLLRRAKKAFRDAYEEGRHAG